jgi:hypothetical protein
MINEMNRRPAWREAALLLVLAFAFLLGLDSLIFRLIPYRRIVEPQSTTGYFEMAMRRELEAQRLYGDNLVATVGDSRMAYYPREAAKAEPHTGYYLRQAGVAGTDARMWYYMLRDLDPSASRYRAVVIAVNDYDDEDDSYADAVTNDLTLLRFVAARLRLTDIPAFVRSFAGPGTRRKVLLGALLRGYAWREDVRGFLDHPEKRLDDVKLANRYFPNWTWDYSGEKVNLAGLEVDWSTFKITFPPNIDENQRATIQILAERPIPQAGRTAAFRRQWMGRIIDRYRNSRTKVIFIRLPRGPIVRPDNLVKKLSSSIREFAARPNVLLANEHAFDSLERRELFKDGLHLNDDGMSRFTVMLAEEIARLLGPPSPDWQSLPDPPHDR